MIRAGSLQYKIIIEKGTKAKDEYGTSSTVWQILNTVKSDIQQRVGRKIFSSDPEEKYHTFNSIFTFRFIKDFGYDCRIKYNGDYYTIQSITPINCKTGFEVVGERNVNDGY